MQCINHGLPDSVTRVIRVLTSRGLMAATPDAELARLSGLSRQTIGKRKTDIKRYVQSADVASLQDIQWVDKRILHTYIEQALANHVKQGQGQVSAMLAAIAGFVLRYEVKLLGNDTITGNTGTDTIIFKGATSGTAGDIARVTQLGTDTIATFTGATDTLNFSETDFGNLDASGGVGAVTADQIVVLANLTTAINITNAVIDGTGTFANTAGGFAIVGTNAASNTVALYFIKSGATVTNNITQALAAGDAVKIADIGIVGSALVATDFVSIA